MASVTEKLTVEEEIMAVTGLKKRARERPELWRRKLIKSTKDLHNDQIAALSDDAQDWLDKAARAWNDGRLIPRLPHEREPEVDAEKTSKRSTVKDSKAVKKAEPAKEAKPAVKKTTKKATKKTTKKKTTARKPEVKKATKKTTKKVAKKTTKAPVKKTTPAKKKAKVTPIAEAKAKKTSKSRGNTAAFKMAMVKNPTWGWQECMKHVAKQGIEIKERSARFIFSDMRMSLRVAAEAGLLKKKSDWV
jgi:DNA polymerase III gamma/tau subunit